MCKAIACYGPPDGSSRHRQYVTHLEMRVVGVRQEAGLGGLIPQPVDPQLAAGDGVEGDQSGAAEQHRGRGVREVGRAPLEAEDHGGGGLRGQAGDWGGPEDGARLTVKSQQLKQTETGAVCEHRQLKHTETYCEHAHCAVRIAQLKRRHVTIVNNSN